MLVRGMALILAGALLAGCSVNEPLSSGFAGAARAAETERDQRDPGKQKSAGRDCARARDRPQARSFAAYPAQLIRSAVIPA